MKKTDIAMIVLIATVSVMIAFFVTQSIVGTPSSETVKVKTIEKIESATIEPSATIFNKDAINPAVKVQINNSTAEQ